MSTLEPTVVPGRSCDNCTMCCKIMGITELDKPRNQECPNCDIGKGCKIYADRPQSCRDFHCLYLTDGRLAEHWKPSLSRMLLTNYQKSRLCVHVDTDRPDAWRKEPYYSDLKRWSLAASRNKGVIAVYVGDNLTVILPTRDKSFGRIIGDRIFKIVTRDGPQGPEFDVDLVAKDGPSLKNPNGF